MPSAGVLGLLLSILMSGDAPARSDSWLGRRVFPVSADVRLRGEAAFVAEIRSVPGEVRRERDDRVYLRAGSVEGWVLKAEVVKLEDAVEHFTRLIGVAPTYAWAYNMRGVAWDEHGKYDEAIADYDAAIKLDPANPIPYNNRGNAWAAKEQRERAFLDFDAAIRLDPEYADAYNNRGTTFSDRYEFQRALEDYTQAVRLDPRHAIAWDNRGRTWANLGEYEKALADFGDSIRVDAEYAPAYKDHARLLATCPVAEFRDGVKAVELALRALELAREPNADYFDTLAAAHAEAGDFDEAVRRQEQAIALAPAARVRAYTARLRLYETMQPSRASHVSP